MPFVALAICVLCVAVALTFGALRLLQSGLESLEPISMADLHTCRADLESAREALAQRISEFVADRSGGTCST